MSFILIIFTAFLTIGLTKANDVVHWGYPDLAGGEDFTNWGGTCDTGSRQSPIDLSLKVALKGAYNKLEFENYEHYNKKVSVVNNGHSIQLYDFDAQMRLKGGPLIDEYVVQQIHLHWWSEHTIDGVRYPLEAHIVHRNRRYPNMTAAVTHKDGVAVVGVLYHVSNEHNVALDHLIGVLDHVKNYQQINKPTEMKGPFAVRELFPEVDGYLLYAGSLTTPPCAESVTWIVLHESFPVTLEQVEKFESIEYEPGKPLKNNYRNIQAANHRPVVAVLHKVYRENAASLATPISIGAVFLLPIVFKLLQ